MRVTAPRKPPAGEGPAPTRITLEFEDNKRLTELYGIHDKHLVLLERRLGIGIINRGNRLALQGAEEAVETARVVLSRLYERLGRGDPVGTGEVEGAIRLAQHPEDLFGGRAGLVLRARQRVIEPRSPAQHAYIAALAAHEMVFGLGPAGTGKTYLAVLAGVSMLSAGRVRRLIFSRPAVEAGERLGFLPGDLREKVDPYLRPIYDALYDCMPADQVEKRLETGDIEIAPLAFMRGRTLRDAFILIDEAQNTSPSQMKMVLTRLGEGGRMVITGDPTQVDLPPGQRSGLIDALEVLHGVDGVGVTRFSEEDVVRHPMVARIVKAYAARDAAGRGSRPVRGGKA